MVGSPLTGLATVTG